MGSGVRAPLMGSRDNVSGGGQGRSLLKLTAFYKLIVIFGCKIKQLYIIKTASFIIHIWHVNHVLRMFL
jgi:hypothetical protein